MLEKLVNDLKAAARTENAPSLIKSLVQDFVKNPEMAKSAMPDYSENDVIIFEDDSISIWYCRFDPGTVVPPHDHKMSATIGVYQGIEQNNLFTRQGAELTLEKTTDIQAGQVVQIAPEAVHGVHCTSDDPSEAIHVYLGALTQVDRSLFDVEKGEEMAFTDENYQRLTQN